MSHITPEHAEQCAPETPGSPSPDPGPSSRGSDGNCWAGLRVAGLCIGVDEYQYMGPLSNAVRDAEAVHAKLRAAPRCHFKIINNPTGNTATAGALQRSVRNVVQEPNLHEQPPEIFLVKWAGHGIQYENRVYLVPANAEVEHPDDLKYECLDLDTLLDILRKELDEPVRMKYGPDRAIVFIIVLDSCRTSDLDSRRMPDHACEPSPKSASLKHAIVFSCERSTTASDGPSGGHSPFAAALLDAKRGCFAEGVGLRTAFEHARVVLGTQKLVTFNLDAIRRRD